MARPLSEEARQKAIDATQALVSEGGIDGFTMDAVAKRSGVAKTTLYRHFSSGNELLVHSLDCQVERIPCPDTGSLEGDLEAMFSMLFAIVNTPGNKQLFLDMFSAAAKDPELATVKEAMMAERKRPLEEIVLRAIDRGEIPAIDLEEATLFIEGPFMASVLTGGEPMTAEQIPRTVKRVVRGLGGQ